MSRQIKPGSTRAGARPEVEAGRRYSLVFVLAVATVCALAGARNFLLPMRPRQKIADQEAQETRSL